MKSLRCRSSRRSKSKSKSSVELSSSNQNGGEANNVSNGDVKVSDRCVTNMCMYVCNHIHMNVEFTTTLHQPLATCITHYHQPPSLSLKGKYYSKPEIYIHKCLFDFIYVLYITCSLAPIISK